MNEEQFERLCKRVWENFLQHENFQQVSRLRDIYVEYDDTRDKMGNGCLMIQIDLLETLQSKQEITETWILKSQVEEMFGDNYKDLIDWKKKDVIYLIPTMTMTGPKDIFNGEMVYPSMKIVNCLMEITYDGKRYRLRKVGKSFLNLVKANDTRMGK
jgi:hypothetical protein